MAIVSIQQACLRFAFTIGALALAAVGNSQELIELQSGSPARASDVNTNFTAIRDQLTAVTKAAIADVNSLQSQINSLSGGSSFSPVTRIVTDGSSRGIDYGSSLSHLARAECSLGDEIVVGAGIDCGAEGFNSSTTNFGTVDFVYPVGNTVFGACSASWSSYDSSKFGPPVKVYAICMSNRNSSSFGAAASGSSGASASSASESKASGRSEIVEATIQRLSERRKERQLAVEANAGS